MKSKKTSKILLFFIGFLVLNVFAFALNATSVLASVCGDNVCDANEICAKDCLQLLSFDSPSSVKETQNTTITLRVKNLNNMPQSTIIEVGIIPVDFYSASSQPSGLSASSTARTVTGCCPGNTFYHTKTVNVSANQDYYITFYVKAPDRLTVDACGNKSAWGTSFEIIAEAYDKCWKDGGGGYLKLVQPITVQDLCTSSQCPSYYWDACYNTGEYCCSGDDNDNNASSAFPQWYCKVPQVWTECTNNNHISCQKDGTKYCTYESGVWKYRDCTSCSGGACIVSEVCGNGVCGTGENCGNCPSDCGCGSGKSCVSNTCVEACKYSCTSSCSNDNTYPGCYARTPVSGYCPSGVCCSEQVVDCSCTIPDGSSSTCSCKSNLDCQKYGNYMCKEVSGNNPCVPVPLNSDCSNPGSYYCDENTVKKCVNMGSYNKAQFVDLCGDKNEYCDAAAVNAVKGCSEIPNHLELWIDYADSSTRVYKQEGDKVKVNLYSELSTSVTLNYDTDIFSGNCPIGDWNVVQGVNSCDLRVIKGARLGDGMISVNGKKTVVTILMFPKYIILTNYNKLLQHFPMQEAAVNALMKQVYTNAQKEGIVYDLSQYDFNTAHPYLSYSNYDQRMGFLTLDANPYVSEITEFAKQKCVLCNDIIIVGDDYVVPQFRNNISYSTGLFFKERGDNLITTDERLISKEGLTFSNYYEMFKIEGKYQGKEVNVIIPDNASPDMNAEVARLEQVLNKQGYNATFKNVQQSDVYCYDENIFNDMTGKTLLIIGTEKDNKAIKCMRSVSGEENRNMAYIEPNMWDNTNYAIVVNTEDESVLRGFVDLMNNPNATANLKDHSAYVLHVATNYALDAAFIAGAGFLLVTTGGAGDAALIGVVGTLSATADVVSGAMLVTDGCIVNYEGIGYCALDATLGGVAIYAGVKTSSEVRAAIKSIDYMKNVRVLFSDPELFNELMPRIKSGISIPEIVNYLRKYGAESSDDLVYGLKTLMGNANDINEIPTFLRGEFGAGKLFASKDEFMMGVTDLGKLSRSDNVKIDKALLTSLRLDSGSKGFWYEIKRESDILAKENNIEDFRLGSKILDRVGNPVQVDSARKIIGENSYIIEEVKGGNQNTIDTHAEEIITQIEKYAKIDEVDGIPVSQRRIVFSDSVTLPESIAKACERTGMICDKTNLELVRK